MEVMASVRAFVVTTVCKSADEFVERYHARVEGQSIFVSAVEERAIGGAVAFAILLADRRPVLAGVCEVIEVFRDTRNEFKRRGMRIGIARLGIDSEAVWAQLLARRDRRLARGTERLWEDEESVDLTSEAVPIEDEAIPEAVDGEDPGLSVAAAIARVTSAAFR